VSEAKDLQRRMLYQAANVVFVQNGMPATAENYIKMFRTILVAAEDQLIVEVLNEEIAGLTEKVKNMAGEQINEDSVSYTKAAEADRKPLGARLCASCKKQISFFHCVNIGCRWCADCGRKVKA
jgi:hypothetical protein